MYYAVNQSGYPTNNFSAEVSYFSSKLNGSVYTRGNKEAAIRSRTAIVLTPGSYSLNLQVAGSFTPTSALSSSYHGIRIDHVIFRTDHEWNISGGTGVVNSLYTSLTNSTSNYPIAFDQGSSNGDAPSPFSGWPSGGKYTATVTTKWDGTASAKSFSYNTYSDGGFLNKVTVTSTVYWIPGCRLAPYYNGYISISTFNALVVVL